nr:ankyrin repeat domain-containing protein [Corallococcus exiguus]
MKKHFSSLDRLRKALPKGFDVNAVHPAEAPPYEVECRPLEWAAKRPKVDVNVIKYLLSLGANPNSVVPEEHTTPLHCVLNFGFWKPGPAETRRRCDAARVLLTAGANPNRNATSPRERARNTPFSYACFGRGQDVRKLLEEMQPLVDMSAQSPYMLLWSAIDNEHEAIVARCLEAGVDIKGTHHYNKATTMLRYAVSRQHDNARIVQRLLDAAPTTPAARRGAANLALKFGNRKIAALLGGVSPSPAAGRARAAAAGPTPGASRSRARVLRRW